MRTCSGADPTLTSLAATKSRAAIHRRGFGLLTVGDEALCGGVPSPFMQKSQYRMSMVFRSRRLQGTMPSGRVRQPGDWGIPTRVPETSTFICSGNGRIVVYQSFKALLSVQSNRDRLDSLLFDQLKQLCCGTPRMLTGGF